MESVRLKLNMENLFLCFFLLPLLLLVSSFHNMVVVKILVSCLLLKAG